MKHAGKPKATYNTPSPGSYNIVNPDKNKYKKASASAFGGNMSKMDRAKTGYLAEAHQFRAPGPGCYQTGSMMSRQASSKKLSSPNMKFGSSGRDDIEKVYMPNSKQTGSAKKTPGPGAYNVTSQNIISRGKSKSKAPQTSFGGNLARVKRSGVRPSTTLPQCGPGTYGCRDGLGTQASSMKRTAAVAKFGTADRTKSEVAVQPGYAGKSKAVQDNPGPGTYAATSAVGKQADAKKPTSYAYSFGSEKRTTFQSKKVPGPGAYNSAPGLGLQSNSKFRTTQKFVFGTSERGSMQNPVG